MALRTAIPDKMKGGPERAGPLLAIAGFSSGPTADAQSRLPPRRLGLQSCCPRWSRLLPAELLPGPAQNGGVMPV